MHMCGVGGSRSAVLNGSLMPAWQTLLRMVDDLKLVTRVDDISHLSEARVILADLTVGGLRRIVPSADRERSGDRW
jgi:hypothetical protein